MYVVLLGKDAEVVQGPHHRLKKPEQRYSPSRSKESEIRVLNISIMIEEFQFSLISCLDVRLTGVPESPCCHTGLNMA